MAAYATSNDMIDRFDQHISPLPLVPLLCHLPVGAPFSDQRRDRSPAPCVGPFVYLPLFQAAMIRVSRSFPSATFTTVSPFDVIGTSLG